MQGDEMEITRESIRIAIDHVVPAKNSNQSGPSSLTQDTWIACVQHDALYCLGFEEELQRRPTPASHS